MKRFIFIILLFFIGCGGSTHTVKYITIIGTSDLQGIMTSYNTEIDLNDNGTKEEHSIGGIDRIATIIKKVKNENPDTIVVSTGDDLMGKYFHYFKGKAIFSLLSKAGYELYAFGNHEFDKESDILAEALDNASFISICTDLNVSSSSLHDRCKPYYLKELAGIKIGFFSLMTEEFPYITLESKVKIKDNNINSAKKAVKYLKEQGAQIIIALTHIGEKADENVAKNVSDIDLMFGGHSHNYLKEFVKINNTLIVNGGAKGTYVVRVDLPININKIDLENCKLTLIPTDESIQGDKLIQKELQIYNNLLPKAIVLGTTDKEWNLEVEEIRKNESNVADMINDLFREQFKVDIVLNNSGAFRGKKIYLPGNVTDERLREIDEFSNYVSIFKLKGKYIKEILEHSAAGYGTGAFLQVSGIRFKININETPQIIEDDKIIKEGHRVSDIKVLCNGNWEDLDENKIYTVLSNDYLVMHSGDKYFWFKKYGFDFKNTYTTFYSIMASYFEKYGKLNPPDKDGRIIVVFE